MWLLLGGGATGMVMTVLKITEDWGWASDIRGTALVIAHAGLMLWGFGMLRSGQEIIAVLVGARIPVERLDDLERDIAAMRAREALREQEEQAAVSRIRQRSDR
jgi:hypothetical protein